MWISMQEVNYSSYIMLSSNSWEKMRISVVNQPFVDFKKANDSVRREVLYNILIELVSAWKGKSNKNVSEWNVKLSPGRQTFVWCASYEESFGRKWCFITNIFNFALEYAIKNIQMNQDGLKLNGTYQFPIYADDVIILGGSYVL